MSLSSIRNGCTIGARIVQPVCELISYGTRTDPHGDPTGAGSPNIRDTKQNKRQTKMQGSAFVSHPLHTINGTHNSKLGIWPETALRYYAR